MPLRMPFYSKKPVERGPEGAKTGTDDYEAIELEAQGLVNYY